MMWEMKWSVIGGRMLGVNIVGVGMMALGVIQIEEV